MSRTRRAIPEAQQRESLLALERLASVEPQFPDIRDLPPEPVDPFAARDLPAENE